MPAGSALEIDRVGTGGRIGWKSPPRLAASFRAWNRWFALAVALTGRW